MIKKITKKNIIVFCSIAILLSCLILFYVQDNKISDLPNENRISSEIKYLDFKEVCEIKISGMEGEGQAVITCEIPELEKRIEEILKKEEENRPNYIDNYTEEEKKKSYDLITEIISLNSYDVCQLSKSNGLKNGDVIKVSCEAENFKYLNYMVKNDVFDIEVNSLSKKIEIPKQDDIGLIEKKNEEESKIFLSSELSDGKFYIYLSNPENYDFSKHKEELVIEVNKENLEKMKDIARKNGNIVNVISFNEIFFKEDNFTQSKEFMGLAIE